MKMKSFVSSSFLIVSFFLFATSCEITYYDEFVIQNNSSYDLKIEAYDCIGVDTQNDTLMRNDDLKKEVIEIKQGASYKVTHATAGFNGFQSSSPFKETEVDSIVIVFNNERIIVQSCNNYAILEGCDVERNMLNAMDEYTREKRNRKEYRYTYTITNEDYDRAVAIATN